MKIQYLLFSLSVIVFMSACSGPQKLYEKGNYFKAYDKALSKLKKDKDRKMRTLVNKAFFKMIDQTRDDLVDLNRNFEINDAEKNLKMYDKVHERFEEGKTFLTEENVEKNEGLWNEREVLISDLYEEGLAFMNDYNSSQLVVDARDAFACFFLGR